MRRLVLLMLALAACGPLPPRPQPVTLPESAMPQGVGDPARGAILSASYVFGQPSAIAGNPAAGAEAIAQLEFLAVDLETDQRWIGMNPLVAPLLAQGRAEMRAYFGIPQSAPPQRVIDVFYGAAVALRAGNRQAAGALLAPLVGPERVAPLLEQLTAFPYLPRAASALAQARIGMMQMQLDHDRGNRRWLF